MDINADVTPSLHPSVIEAVEGFGSFSPYVTGARDAFADAYAGLSAIHNARRAVADDPTLTESAKLLAVADFADRHSDKILRKMDSLLAGLNVAIREHEAKLTGPVQQAAAAPIAAEIRSFVKTLKPGERAGFLNDALRKGDHATLSSVLGAPAYLSGLTDVEKEVHARAFHERANPEVANRLAVMTKVRDLVEQRGPLVMTEIERAIGGSRAKVSAARQAANKSKAAFAQQ
ncbi:hypothetical protein [Cupriavidus plantarum]|uniref:hypothetical protein n=1 Tax=Cupriavidus plantarum TaxID=942865 RepID=UPI000EB222FF|nr:hypothetical protein [Cupriavidus plantarum]RLK44534.1 hypothetical protein C7417_0515 [Cupriavidus plantarum]